MEWFIDWFSHVVISWLTNWLNDWLTDWLTDCLMDCLIILLTIKNDWLVNARIGWLTNWLTYLLSDWLTHKMADLLLTVWLINWLVVDWNIIWGWQAWLTLSTLMCIASVNSQSLALTIIFQRPSSFVPYNRRFFVDLSKERLVLYQLPVFHKNVFKARNW